MLESEYRFNPLHRGKSGLASVCQSGREKKQRARLLRYKLGNEWTDFVELWKYRETQPEGGNISNNIKCRFTILCVFFLSLSLSFPRSLITLYPGVCVFNSSFIFLVLRFLRPTIITR